MSRPTSQRRRLRFARPAPCSTKPPIGAFATLEAGDGLDVETRSLLRLAATNAAHVGAEVTGTVYRLSGTTGIVNGHPIARHMQDAMIVPQHAFLADGTWQSAGKVLLGLGSIPGFP